MVAVLCCSAVAEAAPRDPVAEAVALADAGRYAEARAKLEAAPRSLESRFQLGLVYRATGDRPRERASWNSFFDDYEAGRIDKKRARALTYVARAAHLLGSWKDANDTYRDAVDADPKGKDGARANIAWGRLFLEKYDAGHAEVCLDDALKILPEDPEARTLLAAVKLEQSYDVPGALKELDRAERAAPGYPEALSLRGKIALEGEDPVLAKKLAARLLAKNPAQLAARTLIAGAALLADDKVAYAAERTSVLGTNPRQSRFFHELGELLVREHRYADAIALEEEAIQVDETDPVARAAYGANLLRLGREAEGLEALRSAWKKDKYNVRSYNLLQLFEEVIPKRYVMIDAPPFRLRVPTSERAVLEQTVVPLLLRAEKALTKLYGFRPKGPVTIELYTDPKHYAVRTIGLPGLDAIGVTFGPVVTAMSPSVGKFNWGMVLWHELAHVYAIEASRSRVPRWFTEGLSEYETTIADPTWTRRTSAEVAGALSRNELLSVGVLNHAFVSARDLPHMVLAYHESAAAVRYFIERAGRVKIMAALKRFGEGKRFEQIVEELLSEDLATFDAGLKASLGKRLAIYDGQLLVRSSDYSDVSGLEERLKANGDDGRARGLLALAKLAAGDTEGAMKLLAQKSGLPSPEMMYASTRIMLSTKHVDEAKVGMEILRRAGGRGADVELLAARVAKAASDVDGAWRALEAAAKADPDRVDPHTMRAELAAGTPRPSACADAAQCQIEALRRAVELEVMDPSLGKKLFTLLAQQKSPDAQGAAERAFDVAPFDVALRLDVASYLADRKDWSGAGKQLAIARACAPDGELGKRVAALDDRVKRRAP